MKNAEDILKNLQRVRLSEVERAEMRSSLDAHIRSNPLRTGIPSPFFHSEFFFRRHLAVMSFAALLLVSSGSALFAEQSLPGDVLYGLKRGVNEEVRGWFADSPEDRALWQLSLAERRLSEIESLSEQNKLSAEVRTELSAKVDEYTQNALEEESQNNEAELFSATVAEDASEDSTVSLMKTAVVESNPEGNEVENTEPVPPSITEAQIDELWTLIKEGQRSIQENRPENGQRPFIRAKGRLLIAEKMVFESKQALKEGNVDVARELFLQAESFFLLVIPSRDEVVEIEPTIEEVPTEDVPSEEENINDIPETREVPQRPIREEAL